MDAFGLRRDRRQHDLRGGDREVLAVMFADADVVQSDPVGEHPLGDQVSQHLGVRHRRAIRLVGDVTEGVESQFQLRCHQCLFPSMCMRVHRSTTMEWPSIFRSCPLWHVDRVFAQGGA
jgi:hypothetical protein